jgi:hypothetical protein
MQAKALMNLKAHGHVSASVSWHACVSKSPGDERVVACAVLEGTDANVSDGVV